MTNLKLIRHLDDQHPNRWTRGYWYPARLPTGEAVEIKRTSGRGRTKGKRYLHIRYEVPLVVIDPNRKKTSMGNTYVHTIHDLTTGEWREV